MRLLPLNRNMRLFARRVVNLGNRRLLPGQEMVLTPNGPGALSWRLIVKLYEQRRVVSEADPYFEELMRGPGMENNPEFARAWLSGVETPAPPVEEEAEAELEEEESEVPAVPPVPPVPPTAPKAVDIVHSGGGWYDVLVNGEKVNEKSLRKDEAEELAEAYHGE
jgi:hypothetical protein